jgi:5-carboxymethyl-2-hydroxymuconate isomerase
MFIDRPPESVQLDYEGEIVVIIGKEGRRIRREDAHEYIAGLTLMNEGTLRDWVRHAKFNVTQGKNFERSGSIGPWMVTMDEIRDLTDLNIETRVNGELRQCDNTSSMMFPIAFQIEYLSTFARLKPGDVIATGTPNGAGARFDPPKYLVPGDVVEVSSPAIGTLRNEVRDEPL